MAATNTVPTNPGDLIGVHVTADARLGVV
jgi:hypothetical protein